MSLWDKYAGNIIVKDTNLGVYTDPHTASTSFVIEIKVIEPQDGSKNIVKNYEYKFDYYQDAVAFEENLTELFLGAYEDYRSKQFVRG